MGNKKDLDNEKEFNFKDVKKISLMKRKSFILKLLLCFLSKIEEKYFFGTH